METFAHCGEVQISMKKDEFLFYFVVHTKHYSYHVFHLIYKDTQQTVLSTNYSSYFSSVQKYIPGTLEILLMAYCFCIICKISLTRKNN